MPRCCGTDPSCSARTTRSRRSSAPLAPPRKKRPSWGQGQQRTCRHQGRRGHSGHIYFAVGDRAPPNSRHGGAASGARYGEIQACHRQARTRRRRSPRRRVRASPASRGHPASRVNLPDRRRRAPRAARPGDDRGLGSEHRIRRANGPRYRRLKRNRGLEAQKDQSRSPAPLVRRANGDRSRCAVRAFPRLRRFFLELGLLHQPMGDPAQQFRLRPAAIMAARPQPDLIRRINCATRPFPTRANCNNEMLPAGSFHDGFAQQQDALRSAGTNVPFDSSARRRCPANRRSPDDAARLR